MTDRAVVEERWVVVMSVERDRLVFLTGAGKWRVLEVNKWGDVLRQRTVQDVGQGADDVLAEDLGCAVEPRGESDA